jgi:hypothetical protein
MRERVHAYGGAISVGPGRSSGWRVFARLRLDETLPETDLGVEREIHPEADAQSGAG